MISGTSWLSALAGEAFPSKEIDESDVSFKKRQTTWFQGLKAVLLSQEQAVYNDKTHQIMRSHMRNEPNF